MEKILTICSRICLTLVIVIAATDATKNVLFLVADDLRYQLGALSDDDFPSSTHPAMHTPNLDKLASKSLVLHQAFVQQAVCSPSRASFLTSRRPDTTRVWDIVTNFRKSGGNFTTIPQFYKSNGYASAGIGKIFHPGEEASGGDDPLSWTEPYFHGSQVFRTPNTWRAVRDSQLTQTRKLIDAQLTDHAISELQRLAPKAKSGEKPFFLAVGFHRPHLPWIFPESILQYYPDESIKVAPNTYAPTNMPAPAWNGLNEIRQSEDIIALNITNAINGSFPNQTALDLRRAYFSCVTYIDMQIGNILDELKDLGLSNNTVISFIGDHGWHLGENGMYGKRTNFDIAAHTPMMISIPGKTESGIVTQELNEFVDLFPTLVESTGFDALPECSEDSNNEELCTEGMSLMPFIETPNEPMKTAVYFQFPRRYQRVDLMGYCIRTKRYRYCEWPEFLYAPDNRPDWNNIYATELYDHDLDKEENNNVGGGVQYSATVVELSRRLREGWRTSKISKTTTTHSFTDTTTVTTENVYQSTQNITSSSDNIHGHLFPICVILFLAELIH